MVGNGMQRAVPSSNTRLPVAVPSSPPASLTPQTQQEGHGLHCSSHAAESCGFLKFFLLPARFL